MATDTRRLDWLEATDARIVGCFTSDGRPRWHVTFLISGAPDRALGTGDDVGEGAGPTLRDAIDDGMRFCESFKAVGEG